MQIEGPFSISVIDNSDNQSRELHLSFNSEFQAQTPDARTESFTQYMQQLQQDIDQEQDANTQQGMLMILQISEQLQPHIAADEIPLSETIVIEIGPSSPFDHLLDKAIIK